GHGHLPPVSTAPATAAKGDQSSGSVGAATAPADRLSEDPARILTISADFGRAGYSDGTTDVARAARAAHREGAAGTAREAARAADRLGVDAIGTDAVSRYLRAFCGSDADGSTHATACTIAAEGCEASDPTR